MRIVSILFGVLTLLWGFLQAPFDHIHPEELEHEITSAPVHIHMHETAMHETAGHETAAEHGPAIAPHIADDDEVDVLWSVTTSAPIVLHASAELGERLTLPAPSPTSAAVLIPQHRGHDPPGSSPKIPRAPPA